MGPPSPFAFKIQIFWFGHSLYTLCSLSIFTTHTHTHRSTLQGPTWQHRSILQHLYCYQQECYNEKKNGNFAAFLLTETCHILYCSYFITDIPRWLAAGTSMLSTPVPARPIAFRLVPAAMTSAVTFVPERTIKPS